MCAASSDGRYAVNHGGFNARVGNDTVTWLGTTGRLGLRSRMKMPYV